MTTTMIAIIIVAFTLAATSVICFFNFATLGHTNFDPNSSEQDDQSKYTHRVTVQVVVLGDIGRSPRMQNHTIKLAERGAVVYLVGFLESDLHPKLPNNPNVHVIPLSPVPRYLQTNSRLLFTVFAPLKIAWQLLNLAFVLTCRCGFASWMLVQNPPSIPTLAIAVAVCFLHRSKLVIDWHNTGSSILALKLGDKHPLVRLSELYERKFAKFAYQHFAVSNTMAIWLESDLGVAAMPLRDRPVASFQPLESSRKIEVLQNLDLTSPYASSLQGGEMRLIISSTSWTQDEDFSLLLDALVGYSAIANKCTSLPRLLAIITGKGRGRDYYLRRIDELHEEKKLSHVHICTGWLDIEDYISLLGAADLGVSLHKSSSGFDLPMKVVDMFGAGLPVVGYSGYASWPELVKEGVNGRGFLKAKDLQDLFVDLFSSEGEALKRLKEGAMKERAYGWDDEWDSTAGNIVFFPDKTRSARSASPS